MRKLRTLSVLWGIVLLPSAAYAQASITGMVTDGSGGVLPGVTVEASSPALIEKTRAVTTDGTGQYRIIDLRPGTYTVTFTLAGFNTVRQEGIGLTGTFTAKVDAELSVGTVTEAITVTGASPIVDVQGVKQQQVITKEILDMIPTARNHFSVVGLIPGVTGGTTTTGGRPDVGGSSALATVQVFAIHGGRGGDQRVLLDGFFTMSSEGSGAFGVWLPNAGNTQEMIIDTAAGSGEQSTGGLSMNIIPRDGGNVYTGGLTLLYANESMQGSNYTQRLKDAGLGAPTTVKKIYDYNPSFGGPLMRDKVWFFAAARWNGNVNTVGGVFANLYDGNPNTYLYVPDLNKPGPTKGSAHSVNGRLTWQIKPNLKASLFHDEQARWIDDVSGIREPAAATYRYYPRAGLWYSSFSSPITNRLLLEGGFLRRIEVLKYVQPPFGDPRRDMIGVLEQSTGLMYRAFNSYFHNANGGINQSRVAMSYVTGAHAFKVGFSHMSMARNLRFNDNPYNLTYRFNFGFPNQITQRAMPIEFQDRARGEIGIFAQDKWTIGRLTANVGIRYDRWDAYYPEQHLGPVLYAPTRDVTIPKKEWLKLNDLSPRMGFAYDLFGDGQTAIRVGLNRYVAGIALGSGPLSSATGNPARTADTITRSWTDANGNFWPDCDLISTAANRECGAMSNSNFGKPIPLTAVDPEVINGWGHREYNWEFSLGMQRQVLPGLSIDVAYVRRSWGNFLVTDNRAVSPSDYSTFSITAPVDARLPDGGGYAITDLYDLNPDKVGRTDNYLTFAKNYGKQIERWHGVDITAKSRPQDNGLLFGGGFEMGRTLTDRCDVVAKVDNPSPLYCRVETNWLLQVKGFMGYTLPRIDVNLAATLQSLPGPNITAIYNAPNAVVAPSLGRVLSGTAANYPVNLVAPGTMYGERLNQVDFRIAKLVRLGRMRATFSFDLYNALNADTVVVLNNNFATWQRPQDNLPARFAKLGLQLDF